MGIIFCGVTFYLPVDELILQIGDKLMIVLHGGIWMGE